MPCNLHAIKVSFLGPTNYRGARVKLASLRYNGGENSHKADTVTLGYDYQIGNTLEQGTFWLTEHGYIVDCTAEAPDFYIVIVEEFARLADAAVNDQAVRNWRNCYG